MRPVAPIAVLALCFPLCASSQQTPIPSIDGYVTSVASASRFAVNGIPVVCNANTEFDRSTGQTGTGAVLSYGHKGCDKTQYVGEPLKVFGKQSHKAHALIATRLFVPPPASSRITGFGIITRVLPKTANATQGTVMVRADGYPVLVDAKTHCKFQAPLKSIANVEPNVWVAFEGTQRADGVVVAAEASFVKNQISAGEKKMRKKWDYNPAKVSPKTKQGWLSKSFRGVDPKKIPPYHDPSMQARVIRIGMSLIPPYQRALPESDPTKIHFRFQLIDSKKFRWDLVTPDGAILVSRQAVQRLQNDSQLAAVLAESVAALLNKDGYRATPALRKLTVAEAATTVGEIFVPGLQLAALAEYAEKSRIMKPYEEQILRVSLGLMVDAGYNVFEAPIANWLLAPKKPKKLSKILMPDETEYLYSLLGTTYRSSQPDQLARQPVASHPLRHSRTTKAQP